MDKIHISLRNLGLIVYTILEDSLVGFDWLSLGLDVPWPQISNDVGPRFLWDMCVPTLLEV